MRDPKYISPWNDLSIINDDETVLYPLQGDELYQRIESGEFGAIAPYVVDLNKVRAGMNVTRFQALAALDQAGLLTEVQTIMANPATPSITKLAWDNALEFKRLSPTVVSLGQVLGLTDEQLDALFTQAKSIEV